LEFDIFGQYGTLIGQLLSIIAIATLLIQLGKWWENKRKGRTSEARIYFVLLLIVIISTNIFSMLRSLDEIAESQKIELQNVKLNTQSLKNENTTLQNQQLIKQVLKTSNEIVNQTKHIAAASGHYLPIN